MRKTPISPLEYYLNATSPEASILRYLNDNPNSTLGEIAEGLGRSSLTTLSNLLGAMKRDQLLLRSQHGRFVFWRVNEDNPKFIFLKPGREIEGNLCL